MRLFGGSKSLRDMTDEELDAAAIQIGEERAADEEKHKTKLQAIGAERDRRTGLAKAAKLREELATLPADVRAEIMGG